MKWGWLTVVAAVAFSTLGCEPFDVDHPGEVRWLRILAVSADPPEGDVGDDISLVPLVDPPARVTTATFTWYLCEPLVVAQNEGVDLEDSVCADPRGWIEIGTGVPFDLTIPDLGGPLNPGDPFFAPLVVLIEEGGDVYWSLKRIYISDASPPNSNPVVDVIVVDKKVGDGPVQVPRATSVGLQTEASEPDDDEMAVEYFVTGGALEDNTSGDLAASVSWTTPNEPGNVTIYAVVRDGRGGTGWLLRTAIVQ